MAGHEQTADGWPPHAREVLSSWFTHVAHDPFAVSRTRELSHTRQCFEQEVRVLRAGKRDDLVSVQYRGGDACRTRLDLEVAHVSGRRLAVGSIGLAMGATVHEAWQLSKREPKELAHVDSVHVLRRLGAVDSLQVRVGILRTERAEWRGRVRQDLGLDGGKSLRRYESMCEMPSVCTMSSEHGTWRAPTALLGVHDLTSRVGGPATETYCSALWSPAKRPAVAPPSDSNGCSSTQV